MKSGTLPQKWIFPQGAIELAFAEVARNGMRGEEGIALWLGARHDHSMLITHVVHLHMKNVVRDRLHIQLDTSVMSDVMDVCISAGRTLVAQIHGHPGTFTDLSVVDLAGGIEVPGYLSIVAPYYGTRYDATMQTCGVHVCEPAAGYRRLSPAEQAERLVISTEQSVELVVLK